VEREKSLMSDERDFAIDDADLESTAASSLPSGGRGPGSEIQPVAPTEAPPALVVIEYRKSRLFSPLVPPLLILLAALGITAYQRQPRPRPPVPAAVRSSPARVIMVEPSETGAAIEPIAVRTTAPAPVAEPPSLPAPAPAPESPSAPAAAPQERVALASRSADEPGPFSPASSEVGGPRPVAAGPPLEPPAPRTSAASEPLSPDSPELAFPAENRRALAQELPPRVTRDAILQEIEVEAAQKKAQQDQLGREVAESKYYEIVAAIQRAHRERRQFHDELRRALRELGDDAGAEIKGICDRYGRDTHPVVEKKVRLDMSRWSARLTRGAKIEKLRADGLPEPRIFDFVASELDHTIGTRGGPPHQNGVRVRAAQRLLMYPPPEAGSAPAPRPTTTARAPAAP
jgi:hypothetical protein